MDPEEWHRRFLLDLERWEREMERGIWWLYVSRTLSEGAILTFTMFMVSYFAEQDPRLWLWGLGLLLMLCVAGTYYHARRIFIRATRNER